MNFLSDATKRISEASEKVAQNAVQSTKGFSDMFANDKLEKIIKKDMPVRASGILWKRRGGLAKLASYSGAWERRYIELKGNVLIYYETTGEETNKNTSSTRTSLSSAPKVPRGYLDLAEEKAAASIAYGHSGAPSPFCISIKVGLAQETKWKLCFDHHRSQMEWLVAISDVSVRCSADEYNQNLLKAAIPKNQQELSLLPRPPPVYEPTAGATPSDGKTDTHQLWALDEYTISSDVNIDQASSEEKKEPSSPANVDPANVEQSESLDSLDHALQVMETLLAQKEKARAALELTVNQLKAQTENLKELLQEKDSQISQSASQKSSQLFAIDSLKQEVQEKDAAIQQLTKEKEINQKELGPVQEALQETNSQIALIAEEKELVRATMQEEIDKLKKKQKKSDDKQQKLIWALKEEFARQLEVQRKEMEELRAASTSTGNIEGTAEEEEQFEDCVQ